MSRMTLREVCAKTGVSRRAIQGFEKAGLVAAIERNERGYLLYDDFAKDRIEEIRWFQKMGFSIKEIQILYQVSKEEMKHMLKIRIQCLKQKTIETQQIIEFAKKKIEEL